MSRSRSKPRVAVLPPAAVAASRERRVFALAEIDIAPENLRHGEPADDDIPLLAETLRAAGQLQPLTVRPGAGEDERPAMALDGRRRLLALRQLLAAGRIGEDFPVEVVVETDPARQAAAAVLTNTAAPVHVADVIAAIGRMLKTSLKAPEIARALGYAEIDIKRLAALSALPPVALDALRQGRMNLRQARLLARLTDPAEQAELAQDALDGRGFQDWRVTERLDAGRVTARDRRFALVGPDGYAAVGGRMEADLFGELAPVLLDPDRLTQAWTARARRIALTFETQGLEVQVAPGSLPDLPRDLEIVGYVYGGGLSEAELEAYRDARDRYHAAVATAEARLAETQEPEVVDPILKALVEARIAMDRAGCGGRRPTVLVFTPSARTGLEACCYAPCEPEMEAEHGGETDDAPEAQVPDPVPSAACAPAPDTAGVTHALHALRTEVGTRGLIRALADDPAAAMTALIARLFGQIVVRSHGGREASALTVSAAAFAPAGGRVIDRLDGEVRQRLDARRSTWEASGGTVIAWVHGLPEAERQALLAELTAVSLDLRETRTDLIRASARAEAAELARLCDADIARHWTPDVAFLAAHAKPQLLRMLEAMGEPVGEAAGLKKPDLVARVAEAAESAGWAPPALNWSRAAPGEEGRAEAPRSEEAVDGTAATAPVVDGDGAGPLIVAPEGEAALAQAAA